MFRKQLKPTPIAWKVPQAGQIWSQIKKLNFLEKSWVPKESIFDSVQPHLHEPSLEEQFEYKSYFYIEQKKHEFQIE